VWLQKMAMASALPLFSQSVSSAALPRLILLATWQAGSLQALCIAHVAAVNFLEKTMG
jgi:hypothetical protein